MVSFLSFPLDPDIPRMHSNYISHDKEAYYLFFFLDNWDYTILDREEQIINFTFVFI